MNDHPTTARASVPQGRTDASDEVTITTNNCDDGAVLVVGGVRHVRKDGQWVPDPRPQSDEGVNQ